MNELEKLFHESYVGNESMKEYEYVDEFERIENLRDHFAGLAMQSMAGQGLRTDIIAKTAYKLADAMLKAREVKSE